MRVNLLKLLDASILSFVLTLGRLLDNIEEMLDKIDNRGDYMQVSDINEFDFDDPEFDDYIMGGSVKVLIQDMDLIKFREDLNADRAICFMRHDATDILRFLED